MKLFGKIREKMKADRGMLIVEASFVYPVMFFTIIFLIYMGNIFFLKAKIDNVVNLEAIKCAAEYADPMLTAIYGNDNHIPASGNIDKDIKPYRYLFPTSPDEESRKNVMANMEGSGFFLGMEPEIINVESKANNYFLYQTYEVTATYKITFPIKFIFSNERISLILSSHAEVPATDTTELIRNTDMVIDYAMRIEKANSISSAMKEKMNELEKFISNFGKGTEGGNGPGFSTSNGIVVNGETEPSGEGEIDSDGYTEENAQEGSETPDAAGNEPEGGIIVVGPFMEGEASSSVAEEAETTVPSIEETTAGNDDKELGVIRNALLEHEFEQAQEIHQLTGKQYVGNLVVNEPGIDGYLGGDPVSLKKVIGKSVVSVLKNSSDAEESASKAGYEEIDLYVDAKGVPGDNLIDFANTGNLGKITTQGVLSNIYVNTADGWVKISNGTAEYLNADEH